MGQQEATTQGETSTRPIQRMGQRRLGSGAMTGRQYTEWQKRIGDAQECCVCICAVHHCIACQVWQAGGRQGQRFDQPSIQMALGELGGARQSC